MAKVVCMYGISDQLSVCLHGESCHLQLEQFACTHWCVEQSPEPVTATCASIRYSPTTVLSAGKSMASCSNWDWPHSMAAKRRAGKQSRLSLRYCQMTELLQDKTGRKHER